MQTFVIYNLYSFALFFKTTKKKNEVIFSLHFSKQNQNSYYRQKKAIIVIIGWMQEEIQRFCFLFSLFLGFTYRRGKVAVWNDGNTKNLQYFLKQKCGQNLFFSPSSSSVYLPLFSANKTAKIRGCKKKNKVWNKNVMIEKTT